MAIVCRECGKRNVDGAQFCANPDCGAYLGWDAEHQTGPIPGGWPGAGPGAGQAGGGYRPPGTDDQSAGAALTLSESTLSVEPGETVSTTATIHNLGSQVEQFATSVLGPAAAWATTEPATLQIYPAGHAECTIRLAPPREVTTPAGQVWFTVQAMSTLHPGLVASANGTLDVGAFREVTAALVPQQTSGRGRTQHRVDITNAGNVVEPVRIEASDPAGKVKFGVPAGEVALPPGKHAVAVPVRPPLRWFKKPSQTPFTVMVTPRPTLAAVRLDGTREIMPLIGGWLPKVAVAVAGLAVVAAALLLVPGSPLNQTGGGGDPTASPSAPGQTPPTGGPGTATPTAPANTPTPGTTTSPPPPGQQAAPTQRIVVNYDGRRARGTDGGAVTRLGTGQWEVTFPFDMRNCAYVATVGDPASQLVFNPGLVFTASGRNSDKGVYVETRTTNGSLSDYPFHLVTRCGNRGLWVVGDGAGAMSRGFGIKNFAHPGTGQWEVTFNDDMRDCVYLATVGDPGRGVVANAGLVFTASGHNGNNNGVYVETKNLNGELTDLPFHLQPACRRDNARWVVIDNAGEARRGTAENTKHLGTGQWEVTFNRDVRSCTHLATVGDPGDGAVADPGLVFTASGHESARGVFVETKNLGGGLQDFPFHLRTIC